MSPDRLLALLNSDSPRWLGEANRHLAQASVWVQQGRDLAETGSPLLDFYRCIHAFKGACSLMAARLPLAASISHRLHRMEGRLAIKDHWKEASSWIGDFQAELREIHHELQETWQQECRQACEDRIPGFSAGTCPESVEVVSGGRQLVFPWASVLEFIPGAQVQGRPLVSVRGELLAVIPAEGEAHRSVLFGVAVQTQGGQRFVVPVQKMELVFGARGQESETKLQRVSSGSVPEAA